MYPILLATHSLVRWMVLIVLFTSIFNAYSGLLTQRKFLKFDNVVRLSTITIANLQLVLGACLYTISPFSNYFLHNFPETIHQREFRFFGMEHSLMMLISVILVTVGSVKAKRKEADCKKFKTIAVWHTIGLLIILLSIPWSFSPFTSRPSIRPFFKRTANCTFFVPL